MRKLGMLLLVAGSALAAPFGTTPYVPKPIEARVPWYTVRPDLSNVSNAKVLPQSVTADQKAALARQAFFARPTAEEQLFYIYENNSYQKLPSFVTTDSVLHTYHVFYDYALRYLEQEFLSPAAIDLSRRLFDASRKQYDALPNGAAKEAAGLNVVFFAVPVRLLGEEVKLDGALGEQLAAQVRLCEDAEGMKLAVTGAMVRFNQFKPRGHYTRSEVFQRYFRAMMWFGLVPMPLESKRPEARLAPTQAALVCDLLAKDAKAREAWNKIYDPTAFYVGTADDLTYEQLGPIVKDIFGGRAAAMADVDAVQKMIARVNAELPKPGIEVMTDEMVQGQEFRLMGQRFIPDSRIMQELTYPKVPAEPRRVFPLGLDVFAVFGNPRAAQILDDVLNEDRYEGYLDQRAKMQAEIQALTAADWQQNLYYGWLYCLLPLQHHRPDGWPMFMRNLGWRDKSLVTSLGSWAELRHDTILYAKQSGVECGGGEEPPPPVPGYVEPEVEVYERLAWLLRLNRDGLRARKLYGEYDSLQEEFDRFIELCEFLATCSRKELRNEALTVDELRTIEDFGGYLERLMLSVASLTAEHPYNRWWDIENKTDRNMAVIADVHTGGDNCLEEAVGHAAEIWVVTPQRGKLVLTRGATFTYYEFRQPADDRLTDEQWQEMLKSGKAQGMPAWSSSYMIGPGVNTPVPTQQMGSVDTGC